MYLLVYICKKLTVIRIPYSKIKQQKRTNFPEESVLFARRGFDPAIECIFLRSYDTDFTNMPNKTVQRNSKSQTQIQTVLNAS